MRMNNGLCDNCKNAKEVCTHRGQVYIMCRKAAEHKDLDRYPRMPVLTCRYRDAL